MAIIPSSTQFIGIAASVNLTEKKSSQLNSETQPYTMQDIIDTAGGGGAGLQLKDGATITSTLQVVADSANTSTALRISTKDVSNFGNGGDETNTAFGVRALNANTGNSQVAIGMNALQNHSSSLYSWNVAIGANAMRNGADEQNVAIGVNAAINYTDWYSVFIGAEAKAAGTGGTNSVNIGWKSGYSCGRGDNVGIGAGTFQNSGANGGEGSIAIGAWSQQNTLGNYNISLGYSALQNGGSTCSNNIAMGYNAMTFATSAQHNIAMGETVGQAITTGTNNICLGSGSGPAVGGGAFVNTLSIGRNARATSSNSIAIGSAAYPYATVTAGAQTQTHYWVIKINGTDYKVLLAS